MLITNRYKMLILCGAMIRLLGYGLMIRLRGQYNSLGELFAQQVVQGIGSGILQTCLLVPPQAQVPHSQISQALSLAVSMSLLGSSVGFAIAGGIYTNTMRPALRSRLGDGADENLVEKLYNSITGVVPAWGTSERDAVNLAVSRYLIDFFRLDTFDWNEAKLTMDYGQFTDVTKYFAYVSLGTSAVAILMCCLLPDRVLSKYVSRYMTLLAWSILSRSCAGITLPLPTVALPETLNRPRKKIRTRRLENPAHIQVHVCTYVQGGGFYTNLGRSRYKIALDLIQEAGWCGSMVVVTESVDVVTESVFYSY